MRPVCEHIESGQVARAETVEFDDSKGGRYRRCWPCYMRLLGVRPELAPRGITINKRGLGSGQKLKEAEQLAI